MSLDATAQRKVTREKLNQKYTVSIPIADFG